MCSSILSGENVRNAELDRPVRSENRMAMFGLTTMAGFFLHSAKKRDWMAVRCGSGRARPEKNPDGRCSDKPLVNPRNRTKLTRGNGIQRASAALIRCSCTKAVL